MKNHFNLSYRQQYQLAMGLILLAICLNWLLMQWQLWQQRHDAQIINRAGRQRMFSQKITKLALQIQYQPQTAPQSRYQLRKLQKEWRRNAAFLQKAARQNHFQFTRRAHLIRKNYPHFKAIDQAITQLLAQPAAISSALAQIQAHEVDYLQNSEALALAFQNAAERHLWQTQAVLGALSLFSFIIVILAIWKIFYPAYLKMLQRNRQIAGQKQILQQQNEELGAMGEELSQQMEELRTAQELLNLRNIELSKYAHHLKKKVSTRDEIIDQQKLQMAEYAFINAHLLRHPLSNIMGLVALLKAEALPPETHLYLDYLNQSAQKLDEIIHRINKAVEDGGGFTRQKL